MTDYKEIANKFAIPYEIAEVKPMGEGFINDTLTVVTLPADAPDYILQRKNKVVFPDVPAMMENICRVTAHLRRKVEAEGGDVASQVLEQVPLRDSSQLYWVDADGEYWTVCRFISGSKTFDRVDRPELAFEGGRGMGVFYNRMQGFDGRLTEIIKGFHNMRLRFEQWDKAVADDLAGRVASTAEEIGWIEQWRPRIMDFQERIERGEFPLRVTHNDTKISNILFDQQDKALCVIDLDTMMTATVFNDFGDALRSYTNTGAEDDPVLDNVSCSMEYFEAYTRGFLGECGSMLTDAEKQWLPFAGLYITFEQVLRFLMDYLNGDTYYKIAYPDHNLVRTRAQYKLLESMSAQYPAMCQIVTRLSAEEKGV